MARYEAIVSQLNALTVAHEPPQVVEQPPHDCGICPRLAEYRAANRAEQKRTEHRSRGADEFSNVLQIHFQSPVTCISGVKGFCSDAQALAQ